MKEICLVCKCVYSGPGFRANFVQKKIKKQHTYQTGVPGIKSLQSAVHGVMYVSKGVFDMKKIENN